MRTILSTTAKKGGTIMNFDGMSDEEILEAVMEEFEEDGRLEMDYLDIEVVDGSVTVSGRVGTEEELQIVDEIVHDTLKIEDYNNKVWVDDALGFEDRDEERGDGLRDLGLESEDIDEQNYEDEEDNDYN